MFNIVRICIKIPFSLARQSATNFCPRLPLPTLRHAASTINLSVKLANNLQFQPHSIQIFTKTHPFETNFSSFYTSEAAV